MSSKSILILGIVVLFLINVLAIHDYVNNHYYSVQITKELKPIILKKEKNQTISTKKVKNDKNKSNTETNEDLSKYKASYISNKEKEQNYTKKLIQNHIKMEKIKEKNNQHENNPKKLSKDKKEQIKKDENKENKNDELKLKAIMSLTFDINQPYQKRTDIVKKLVSKVKKDKKVVIIIYQYSLKIQDYLKEIKADLVELGMDIDDISTIYKKNKNKKDKIKVLLVKKD